MKRPGISSLRYLLAAVTGVVLIVCGIFLFAPSRTADRAEPNIDGLKQILERSAEDALPLPSVSDDQIVLKTDSSGFESEIERVIEIAADLGGTALQTGEDEVLTQIPVRNVPEFHARVTGKEPGEFGAAPVTGDSRQLIAVYFEQRASGASSRPEPTP